jgi:hypothetical protein
MAKTFIMTESINGATVRPCNQQQKPKPKPKRSRAMLDVTTNKPADPKDSLVGVSVFSGANDYFFLRLHIRKPMLERIGNPKKLSIRGQPANGFIIAGDPKGLKPQPLAKSSLIYLATTITNFDLSHRARRAIYMRPEFSKDNSNMRLPPLPPAWIDAHEEFIREVHIEPNPGNGASPTAPLPKPQAPAYQVPADADFMKLQTDLGIKLAEARAIIQAMEKRTHMRFVLDRNLRLVVNLTPPG